MGIKLTRRKKRNIKLSLAYRAAKLIPLRPKAKLRFLLDMAWIFSRLAHEQFFKTSISLPQNDEDILVSFITPSASVLDIGCGKGYIIKRILHRTSNIVGIDYNMDSIAMAKAAVGIPGVSFICEDIDHYLQKNQVYFDYLILSHVLEHMDEPDKFLKRIRAIGKYCYIEVPDFESNYLNVYRQAVNTDLMYSDADHVSEFDRNELQKIIEESGWKIVRCEFRFGVMKYWCE